VAIVAILREERGRGGKGRYNRGGERMKREGKEEKTYINHIQQPSIPINTSIHTNFLSLHSHTIHPHKTRHNHHHTRFVLYHILKKNAL
jgi:hypothetical protein